MEEKMKIYYEVDCGPTNIITTNKPTEEGRIVNTFFGAETNEPINTQGDTNTPVKVGEVVCFEDEEEKNHLIKVIKIIK